MRLYDLRALLVVAVAIVPCLAMAAEEARLSRADIAKRAKVAMAFVDGERGSGTAFCIHGSGIFITNERLVRRNQGVELKLVLNSGEESQQVVAAKVLKQDEQLDLVALKAEGVTDWPSLALGDNDTLSELQEAFAGAFPSNWAAAANEGRYPELSMNAGTITALRKKDGELDRIQLDVVLNPGNSGGPVLDEQARVIGIIAKATNRGTVNYAIPVTHLMRFVETPVIEFTPPTLHRDMLDQAVEFRAVGISILPGEQQPNLTLSLRSADEPEPRVFPMTLQDGAFVASASPYTRLPAEEVEIAARFASGSVSGVADDVSFSVGEESLRLHDVSRITPGDKPQVVLVDGPTTLEGTIQGLDAVDVRFGGEVARLNLAKAKSVQVQTVRGLPDLVAAIVATVNGREISRLERQIPVGEISSVAAADVNTVEILPPILEGEAPVRLLPEPFLDVAQGGGGRYLIFHLPRLHKLAVFDVNAAEVTGYIPLAEAKVAFAAGLDSVVIGFPVKNSLERWRLSTLTQELVALPDSAETIATVVMGHGSNGPVVVNGMFLDLATLRPLPVNQGQRAWDEKTRPIASADGTLYGTQNGQNSPTNGIAWLLEGGQVTRVEAGDTGHVVPGPDGSRTFLGKGVASRNLQYAAPADAKLGWTLPAARGSLFASFDFESRDMSIRLPDVQRPVAVVPKVLEGMSVNNWDREEFGAWRRVYFIPQANLVVGLPETNDRLVLHHVDTDAALEDSGIDYLFVTSQPPRSAAYGSQFSYPLFVKAKHEPVSYRLESGPAGMTISSEGIVQWQTPQRSDSPIHGVVVTVRDQLGREIQHSFAIQLQ